MIAETLREAVASARSQPVTSLVTVLMVAGMIVAVMLTTGRTVGAEQQVLGSIDSAGTRSIMIRAEDGAGITSDVLDRIQGISGIEWSGAFSSAVDATNATIPDGTRVPARFAYSHHLNDIGIPPAAADSELRAYASPLALTQLGLPDVAGAIALTSGVTVAVANEIVTPDYLKAFEPLVVVPQTNFGGDEPVNLIIVIAERPELVTPVSAAVETVLAASDPTKVTVQTSEPLAQLRALIQGQLGSFSRGLVLALLALTGTLVAVLLSGLVMMRRKDFGRRRALGASRSLIVALLLCQTAILAVLGIALGIVTSFAVLGAARDPLPGATFVVALGILTLTTAIVSALIPSLVASRREPIRELRVP